MLLIAGWDVEGIDVAGCNVGGASGVMGVDTGDIGLEVFNCINGEREPVVDPTPVPNPRDEPTAAGVITGAVAPPIGRTLVAFA